MSRKYHFCLDSGNVPKLGRPDVVWRFLYILGAYLPCQSMLIFFSEGPTAPWVHKFCNIFCIVTSLTGSYWEWFVTCLITEVSWFTSHGVSHPSQRLWSYVHTLHLHLWAFCIISNFIFGSIFSYPARLRTDFQSCWSGGPLLNV